MASPRKRVPKAAKTVYPVCVRHLKERKDVRLRHYFLCDGCTDVWTRDAFAGNPSLYTGERVDGICLLCNQQQKDVRLRTWFLCDICHRVAGSIGRNHVAEQSILDFWASGVVARFPWLEITQNDKSALRPHRTADAVTGEGPLDFLITDTRIRRAVFGIENKTGRGAIGEMSQFQLDRSDCDSILHHMRELSIPAFIIHAQVLEIWKAPTVGFRTVGLWWTDVFLMTEHFKSMRMRGDEKRPAAYFGRKAFAPIDTLPDALYAGDTLQLVARLAKDGLPPMYRL